LGVSRQAWRENAEKRPFPIEEKETKNHSAVRKTMIIHIWITLIVAIFFGAGTVLYLVVNRAPCGNKPQNQDGGHQERSSFDLHLPLPPEHVEWAPGIVRRSRSLDPDNLQTES
jgi:hypothetical protein